MRKFSFQYFILLTPLFILSGCDSNLEVKHYPDGTILSEIPFKNDKIDGTAKWYHKNGTLDSIVNFKSGIKDGELLRYLDNKGLVLKSLYENDTLVFYEKFDGKGNFVTDYRMVTGNIPFEIKKNKLCKLDFILKGPKVQIEDSLRFSIALFMDEDAIVDDEGNYVEDKYFINEVFNINENKFTFEFTPKRVGTMGLSATFNSYKNGVFKHYDYNRPKNALCKIKVVND